MKNVKSDVLAIIKESIEAIKDNDSNELKKVSDHTLHNASIFQDQLSIPIAVVVYSLAKIYERHKYRQYKDWEIFNKNILEKLEKAQEILAQDNEEEYKKTIGDIMDDIANLEDKFGFYITEVLNQSRIKKSSRIYEHGISASKAAELLGISMWDLMTYLGNTKIIDSESIITKKATERFEMAKKIFNIEK